MLSSFPIEAGLNNSPSPPPWHHVPIIKHHSFYFGSRDNYHRGNFPPFGHDCVIGISPLSNGFLIHCPLLFDFGNCGARYNTTPAEVVSSPIFQLSQFLSPNAMVGAQVGSPTKVHS